MHHLKIAIAIVGTFVILEILYILYRVFGMNKATEPFDVVSDISGKTVWILWFQGWDAAPKVVLDVKRSWVELNPEWKVRAVSDADLPSLIPGVMEGLPKGISAAARSDVVRLNLLSKYGGVWADSTMLCMRPLDDWVYPAVEPSGFWMYHGGADERGPASWFIVSQKGSYIIERWKAACDAYWKGRSEPHDYFWMDSLFHDLISSDPDFDAQWSRVPYVSCEAFGQAHALAGRCSNVDPDVQAALRKSPPYALKLTRHESGDFSPESNAGVAISIALGDRSGFDPIQLPPPSTYRRSFLSDTVVVVADCTHEKDVLTIRDACAKRNYDMIVYDKCNFCKHVPSDVYGRPMRNQGREQQTYLQFVVTYYETLPENIVLVPGNLSKYNREQRMIQLFDASRTTTGCEGDTIASKYDFTLDTYMEGVPILPASVRPFGKWFETFVGPWNEQAAGPCWNGIMRTTRERIHSHPLEFYVRLDEELKRQAHNSPEAGHYMERSMSAVF
jgi:hypothetical protein